MIYLIYGKDTTKARQKLRTLIDNILTQRPDTSHIRLNDEDFDTERLQELISGQGLFERRQVIVFDQVLGDKETSRIILERLSDIAQSENIFIFYEESLTKAVLSKIEKKSEKVQEFTSGKSYEKKKRFDIFLLTDALGKRDKKRLWVLYHKALSESVAPEEVCGILFWQIKSMILAGGANSAKEAGLNPFVFKKSQSFLARYSEEELGSLSARLVDLYHNARRGVIDFSIGMEQFILKI